MAGAEIFSHLQKEVCRHPSQTAYTRTKSTSKPSANGTNTSVILPFDWQYFLKWMILNIISDPKNTHVHTHTHHLPFHLPGSWADSRKNYEVKKCPQLPPLALVLPASPLPLYTLHTHPTPVIHLLTLVCCCPGDQEELMLALIYLLLANICFLGLCL